MIVLYLFVFAFVLSICMLLYVIKLSQEIKKRPPKDFAPSWFLSDFAKQHRVNPIRKVMAPLFAADTGKEIVTFAGGRPSDSVLPLESITLKAKSGFECSLEGAELSTGLQYGLCSGPRELREWIRDFMESKDGKLPDCIDITPGVGCNHLIVEVMDMVYRPGDVIACANPLFCAVPQWATANNVQLTPISQNSNGLDCSELKALCERTPIKILYVVPNGSNPTGITMTESCRRAVYALAERYNFLILSDDPYRFATGEDDIISFLKLDAQSSNPGRVIRLDSFSKILSPGIRLGWMTGHKLFIERIQRQIETRVLSPSYLDMMLAWKFLSSHPNFENHLEYLRRFYAGKRDSMIALLKKHFAPHGATWYEPSGGFFVWLDLSNTTYQKNTWDSMETQFEYGVIACPGNSFSTDGTGFDHTIRLSFSEATEDQMERGIPKLAQVFFGEMKHQK